MSAHTVGNFAMCVLADVCRRHAAANDDAVTPYAMPSTIHELREQPE
jgi:hypothetical protein